MITKNLFDKVLIDPVKNGADTLYIVSGYATAAMTFHHFESLKKNHWQLGGESSGHIVHLGITTTGDGIVSALQVLTAVYDAESTLHDLKKQMTKMPQSLINLKLERPVDINDSRIQNTVRAIEARLGKYGRILLRKSGTEPLFRIMVEGEDYEVVDLAANELAEVIRNVI